jgi:hypothetical protein
MPRLHEAIKLSEQLERQIHLGQARRLREDRRRMRIAQRSLKPRR